MFTRAHLIGLGIRTRGLFLHDLVADHNTFDVGVAAGTVVATLSGFTSGATVTLNNTDGVLVLSADKTQLLRGLGMATTGPYLASLTQNLGSALNSPLTTTLNFAATSAAGIGGGTPVSKGSPSALWNTTAGSGFDPTGVSAAREPTPSVNRTYLAKPRPACRPFFHNRQTVDRDTKFGWNAAFDGKASGAKGLLACRVHMEGNVYDVTTRSTNTYTDVRSVVRNDYLYHFALDYAATVSLQSAGGTVKFYIEAIANDPDSDSQVIGPFFMTAKPGLLTAPWDPTGQAIYDGVYQVDKNLSVKSGNTYTTWPEAVQQAITDGKKCAMITLMRDGAHPQWRDNSPANQGVWFMPTGGTRNPNQMITFAADPRTVSTSAWLGAGDATFTSGLLIGQGAPRFLGPKTQINITQFGAGFNSMRPFAGSSPINMSMVFEGVELTTGAQPSDPLWNGKSGALAMYNGSTGLTWIGAAVNECSFSSCDLHDMLYGIAPPTGLLNVCVWNTECHKVFKFTNIMGGYNIKHLETGQWNNDLDTTVVPAFDWWYTGTSPNCYFQKFGNTGNSGWLSFYESNNTVTLAAQAAQTVSGSGTVQVTANSKGSDLSGHYCSAGPNWEMKFVSLATDNGGGNGVYNVTVHPSYKVGAIAAGTYYWSTADYYIPPSGNVTTNQNDFVAWLATVPFLGSNLLISSFSDQRQLGLLWTGTYPTTGQSVGLTALTQLGNSSAKTRISFRCDAHCDAFSYLTATTPSGDTDGKSVLQNVILDECFVWGKKAGQCIFFAGAAAYADMYFKNLEFHDNSTDLGVGFSGFGSGIASYNSNVVMKNITAVGSSESMSLGYGNLPFGYVGDTYCKFQDMFWEASLYRSATGSPLGDISQVQIAGIFCRTSITSSIVDIDGAKLGSFTTNGGIVTSTSGVAPYGYKGAGTPPNLTPANSTVLLEPTSGRIAGSRNLDGSMKNDA